MRYENVETGIFKKRPNRFIAHVEIRGREEICHVKNTGRCRELLVPGTTVFVSRSSNPNRKTKYDLIAVKKGERLINMDSQAPNQAVEEWLRKGELFGKDVLIKERQCTGIPDSISILKQRIEKIFMEVKGVTLERREWYVFPMHLRKEA